MIGRKQSLDNRVGMNPWKEKCNDSNLNCNRKKVMHVLPVRSQNNIHCIRIENLPHLQQGMTHNEAMNLGYYEFVKTYLLF